MVCSEFNVDFEVRARRHDRNSDATSIIPRLPDTQTLSGHIRTGATIRCASVQMTRIVVAVRTTIRAVPELLGHTVLPILVISHPLDQFDLAHRVDQPSMTGDMRGEECKRKRLQHLWNVSTFLRRAQDGTNRL